MDDMLGFPAEHNRLYELEATNAPMRAHGKSDSKEGLIVIRYYLALRGAENGVTVMVTPFFCVQG